MALIHCNFTSETLRLATAMDVILPQPLLAGAGKARHTRPTYPTLYLLHGLSDDHTTWQRRTSIERYVAPLNLAVVMPAVHRSFYADMANGYRYWTFVSEELPAVARSFFPLSDRREENFVAGLSMGGYGAFKLALTHPERFAAAASLSGVFDLSADAAKMRRADPFCRQELRRIFGGPGRIRGSSNDLFCLAQKLARHERRAPALFQCCGTQDYLYRDNLRFRDYARSLGLNLTYEEGPGQHEWGFWDKWIQRVLEWLPLKR